MSVNAKDLYKLLDDIDHHARAITAKHQALRTMLAEINFPRDEEGPYKCSFCDFSFGSERSLAFHMQNVHGGPPVPLEEWERRA